ncbi:MAG TPA: PQQ-binding-like beta-propeller repeat protein [Thermoanaerobaculia bacterium]|nr:PQQ-binding-like beta-propeller repeat protein [Thermoanaerobaculia bacterium]
MRALLASITASALALSASLLGEPPSQGEPSHESPPHETPPHETPPHETPWHQWRGPLSTGESPDAEPPIEWSETKNVRWKVALPGKGHSTPIVTGDRVYVTAAFPTGEAVEPRHDSAPGSHHAVAVTRRQAYAVIAVDRTTGAIEWQRTVHSGLPHEGGHHTGTYASASPVTDGEHVFAFFGSRGLYALSLDGEVEWQLDLGDMNTKHAHGEGASPALHEDTLIVNWDHEGPSFLVALDKRTGKERWRSPRDEVSSWATPIVVEHEGRSQVIVSGTKRIRAYDLESGAVIWECGGLSANIVASPVAADGMVFAGSSYDSQALLAIRLAGSKGDITGSSQVVWQRDRLTPYVPSPLLYEGKLYYLRHYQGILSRVEAENGAEPSGPFRLRGVRDVYASPVAAAGRIYITDRQGVTIVMTTAATPEILAVNRLDDSFSASAAVVGREIYLRGESHLYSLAD